MCKREDRRSTQKKKILIICLLILFQLYLIIIELKIKKHTLECVILVNIHDILKCKDDWIQDVFFLVWATAVAVAIFIVETSKEYKYGITLKKIIRMTIGVPKILAGAIAYLLLCILFFVVRIWGCSYIMIELACLSKGGLIFALCFWIRKSTGTQIRALLEEKTINQLKISCNEVAYDIDEVIDHIDYNSDEDTQNLKACLKNICKRAESEDLFYGRIGNHIWLMGRIYRMISLFDISDRYRRIQMGNLLWEIWIEVSKSLGGAQKKDDERRLERQKISYAIQIFIPLIDTQKVESNEVLFRLWRRMEEYGEEVLPYLLCYSEYICLSQNIGKEFWLFQSESGLDTELERIMLEGIEWDEKLAVGFWIDWERFHRYDDNYGLKYYFAFENDIRKIQKGMPEMLSTITMKNIYARCNK